MYIGFKISFPIPLIGIIFLYTVIFELILKNGSIKLLLIIPKDNVLLLFCIIKPFDESLHVCNDILVLQMI